MATALLSGLLSNGAMPEHINVIEPDKKKHETLYNLHTVNVFSQATKDNLRADYLFFCVKPQIMQAVCRDLAEELSHSKAIIISVAAGVTIHHLKKWLNTNNTVIRCMPNTPALIGLGASGLFSTDPLTENDKNDITMIFSSLGTSIWTSSENDIDTVTAVSGSGPAYFFRMIEAMLSSATELGLNEADATHLIIQTALGAAQMAKDSHLSIQQLRQNVTSKGGTTAAALDSLTESDFDLMIHKAIQAARERSIELAKN